MQSHKRENALRMSVPSPGELRQRCEQSLLGISSKVALADRYSRWTMPYIMWKKPERNVIKLARI